MTEHLLKTSTNESEEFRQQIQENVTQMEQKWHRLMQCVEKRIVVAKDYLQFVKLLNQFRNARLDLQELFKTINEDLLLVASKNANDSVYEHHVHEKMHNFESLYKEVIKSGQNSISLLERVETNLL